MAFVRDDELIILMDLPLVTGRMLTVAELKRLRDIGIRTTYWADTSWDRFVRPDGSLMWSYFDDYISRVQAADMKCIIPLWNHNQSKRFKANYYVKIMSDGFQKYKFGMLSPWNKEAQDQSNSLLERIRDRLTSDMCQVVNAQALGGEKVLLNIPAYYDDYALADWHREHEGTPDHTTPEGNAWLKQSYINLLVEQQKIMVNTQHREIWFMLSRYKGMIDSVQCTGCEWIDDYLIEFKKLKPVSINHISFNYFPYGELLYPIIQKEKRRFKVNEFVGAEYCEGLRDGNGKVAIDQALRLIVGPTHGLTAHTKLEDWMLEVMKENINYFYKENNYG